MNKNIALIAAAIIVGCALTPNHAADLAALQGRWTIAKTNQEGQAFTQVLQFENDQFTFQILGSDSKVRFFSKGTAKTTKADPLDLLSVTGIRAGRSAEELQPVDDTRSFVYTIRDNNLFLASNFDRVRQNEKPAAEMYVRAADSKALNPEAGLVGKWKMDVALGDNNYDYELRIAKGANQLEGVMVSPRSGEHRCKMVQLEKNNVVIEIDRNIQGTEVTFVYKGKLTADRLSGQVEVRGQDGLNGTWTASKR
jgi:hypothetical protein